MPEQSLQFNPVLYKYALDVAKKKRNDYLHTVLKAINPNKMSQADINLCEDIISGWIE